MSRKTVSNVLFITGVTCLAFGLFSCEALGISSSDAREMGANAADTGATVLKTIGASSGNPLLIGVGGVLTAIATYLRVKNNGNSKKPVDPPSDPVA